MMSMMYHMQSLWRIGLGGGECFRLRHVQIETLLKVQPGRLQNEKQDRYVNEKIETMTYRGRTEEKAENNAFQP